VELLEPEPALQPGQRASGPAARPCLRQNEPMDTPDPPLSADAAADRPADLARLYVELRGALLAFLRKHTGDVQVAEDLLHDVVLKALAATRTEADTPRNLTGWLYAVARNAAMDHHRRSRPTEELPEELAAADDDAEEAATRELASCLRPMAERLPAAYRGTLIAAEFDGLALAEVARRQGLSLSAVKTRASRGRRMLQQELVKCCRVALSAQGQVLDYDARKAAACAPSPSGCSPRPRAH
jgi:RNA polymerase sigma-70 factor (ECF subfamily)